MPVPGTRISSAASTAVPIAGSQGAATSGLAAPSALRPRGLALTFRSLRHRSYRLYFFGQLISLVGSWIQTTALTWLAYALTEQSTWAALVSAAQILPTFVLGAWGGALADHWPRRMLIFWTQTAFTLLALLLTVLVFTDDITPWSLLAISLANGVVLAIDLPARLAFVMDLVGREDLTNAVGLNSLLFNMARTAGPAIAGYTLWAVGPGPCFLLNGISYVPLLVALLAMDVAGHSSRKARGQPSVAAGFRYLMGQPPLAFMIALAGLVSLCAWPFMALLPAFAKNALAVEERGFSQLLSATGCGALLAALAVASCGSARHQRAFIAAAIALISCALVALSASRNLTLATLACASIGFGLILFFATSQSMVQLAASDSNRGRVMGIWAMILSGAVPLGNLLSGPAADYWGEAPVLCLQGIACGLSTLGLLLVFRLQMRRNLKN